MSQKHTPGPWHVEDPMGDICLSIVDDAEQVYDWKMVANVTWSEKDERGQKSYVSRQTAEANARLIASAPEMLEGLKGIRANLVRLAWEENSVMIEGIDALIAKAEGRHP